MRICFLGDAGSIHLRRWVDYFIKAGYEVDIISFSPCPIEGPTVHLLAKGRTGRLAYIIGMFKIRRLLKKIQPDLLHAHYATSFGLLAVLSGFHPLVVSAWGSDVLVAPKQSILLKLTVELVLKKADALTSDSSYMSRCMLELLKGRPKILKTVTMGVSREWFKSLSSGPKNELQILSLRGHQVIYNIDIILRSMADVLQAVPEAVLVVAGEGPETNTLQVLASSLGILENVKFVGQLPHDQVKDYLNQSAISVSVPSSDATAVSLLETMACGSFPVVSDLPANREWVEDSVNGLIVAIRDTSDLSRALLRSLQDIALRRNAIELNRQKIRAKAIWENNMAEMEELYRELQKDTSYSPDKQFAKRLCLMANAASPHTEKWAAELARRGWKVDIISFLPAEIPRVKVHVVPYLMSGRTEFVFLRLRWITKTVRNLQPDIVHVHYATSFGFLGAVAKVHPLIISAWGSDIFSFPRTSFLHRYLLEKILRKADVLCSTSRTMAAEMQKYVNPESQIDVIPFGVDIELFSPPARQAEQNPGMPVIFGVAKYLQPVYGLDILIRAFALLEKRCPGRALLRIAGDGPEKKKLQNLAAQLGITQQVKWLGAIPNSEVADLYRSLDVVVVPSRQESFGVTAVEGSACGCPIIASNVGGLPEVVIDQKTGLLIPPENVQELCTAMEFMIIHPEKRLLMGQNGRELVIEHYDFQRNVTQMEEVYNRSLNTWRT
ncbi:MAG TPA: glycosyltransferase [Desulfitobacteriaceae bacterium]|nr:glycosyltransferase [Desulfitobacteriaceae bacterium]